MRFSAQIDRLKCKYATEEFFGIHVDVETWFHCKHDLAGIELYEDGFYLQDKEEAILEDLEEEGLIENIDGIYDFTNLENEFLEELEKALQDPSYNTEMCKQYI